MSKPCCLAHKYFGVSKNNNEEILYLLIDLVALAKIDNEFHITEKLFIKENAYPWRIQTNS